LAVAVGLSEIPVLPQKLLEEMLPGVGRALFKRKISEKKPAFFKFLTKFRAKSCVLNPKLGDWACRFFELLLKFCAKNYALNTKLGDWEDRQDPERKKPA
jgi:hypothetical protein